MDDVLLVARLFLFVREAVSQNNGQRVNAIQIWSGGHDALGTSWCAWFVTMVLDLAYQGNAPIPRQGGAQGIRDLCTTNGWMTDTPSVGDLYFYVDGNDHAHHVGIVSNLDPLTGISGNTSADGTSSNGDRVAEHTITATHFAHYQA